MADSTNKRFFHKIKIFIKQEKKNLFFLFFSNLLVLMNQENNSKIFHNKEFVVSGGSGFDNKQVRKKIKKYGGKVNSRLTKKVSIIKRIILLEPN